MTSRVVCARVCVCVLNTVLKNVLYEPHYNFFACKAIYLQLPCWDRVNVLYPYPSNVW